MKNYLRTFAAAASTALLAACGGGDVGYYSISPSEAVGALSASKGSNTAFVTQLVNLSNAANPILVFTAANTASAPSGSRTYTANCKVSGTYSYVYSKARFAAGLSAGDYYSVTYSQCVETAGGATVSGSVIVSATTTTAVDQSTSSAFSLPVSVTFSNYSEATSSAANTFNGTVNYSVNSVSANGAESLTGATGSLTMTATTGAGTSSATFTNAALVYNVPASGATTLGTAFDVSVSPSSAQYSVQASLVGPVGAPTSGTYTVTNIYGGRIVGNLPSNVINIDDDNDGTFDASFVQAF
jgi:hypothetical protein